MLAAGSKRGEERERQWESEGTRLKGRRSRQRSRSEAAAVLRVTQSKALSSSPISDARRNMLAFACNPRAFIER